MRKIIAFIKKDFLVEASYRLSFFLNILSVFLSVLVYFFIDKLFGSRVEGHLSQFGVDYFSYVLVSMALFSYIGVGLGSFSQRIRTEQVQGTFESLLLCPASLSTIISSLIIANLCIATVDLVVYALMGIFLFHIDFSQINPLSTLVVLLCTFFALSGLGILSASYIVLFKRGNPGGWVINNIQGLISGVYFPVTVLPAWMQWLSRCLPTTYAVKALQLAVYQGATLHTLRQEIGMLILFGVLLIPCGFLLFSCSIRRAKRTGSLANY